MMTKTALEQHYKHYERQGEDYIRARGLALCDEVKALRAKLAAAIDLLEECRDTYEVLGMPKSKAAIEEFLAVARG